MSKKGLSLLKSSIYNLAKKYKIEKAVYNFLKELVQFFFSVSFCKFYTSIKIAHAKGFFFFDAFFSSFCSVCCSGFELASVKAAQHRLGRGVWTSVRFGDMRRALSGIFALHLISFLHLNRDGICIFLFCISRSFLYIVGVGKW